MKQKKHHWGLIICAVAFLVMLLGNVYFTKNQLYTADDNEFLLAMPIPPRAKKKSASWRKTKSVSARKRTRRKSANAASATPR